MNRLVEMLDTEDGTSLFSKEEHLDNLEHQNEDSEKEGYQGCPVLPISCSRYYTQSAHYNVLVGRNQLKTVPRGYIISATLLHNATQTPQRAPGGE